MSDHNAFIAWIIRGLGGVVRLVKRAADEGVPVNDEWLRELIRCADELDQAVKQINSQR